MFSCEICELFKNTLFYRKPFFTESASGVIMLHFLWRLLQVKATTHSCFPKSHQIPRKRVLVRHVFKTRPLDGDLKNSFYVANVDIFIDFPVLKRAVQNARTLFFL